MDFSRKETLLEKIPSSILSPVFSHLDAVVKAHADNIASSEQSLVELQNTKDERQKILRCLRDVSSKITFIKQKISEDNHNDKDLINFITGDHKFVMAISYDGFPDPKTKDINWFLYSMTHIFDKSDSMKMHEVYDGEEIKMIKRFWRAFEAYKKYDLDFAIFTKSMTYQQFSDLNPEFSLGNKFAPLEYSTKEYDAFNRFKVFLCLSHEKSMSKNFLPKELSRYIESVISLEKLIENINIEIQSSKSLVTQNSFSNESEARKNLSSVILNFILSEDHPELFHMITKDKQNTVEFDELLHLKDNVVLEKMITDLQTEIVVKIREYEKNIDYNRELYNTDVFQKYHLDMVRELANFKSKLQDIVDAQQIENFQEKNIPQPQNFKMT